MDKHRTVVKKCALERDSKLLLLLNSFAYLIILFSKNFIGFILYDHGSWTLAGRDFQKDPLHDQMILANAVMKEKQGWERPGYFFPLDS
ncbi:GL24081 [Drosophila persimilis]|uniref:GL24081 n=1 Tax=Drosophila persimilis TaxID=7234 RepID=B4G3C3_DROPE|nr:GL24081 [Drosophila persimilis]